MDASACALSDPTWLHGRSGTMQETNTTLLLSGPHRLPEPEDACDVCYLPQASKCFFSNEVHVCEEAQRVSNYALLLDQDF
jgi:hypothetical protein